MHAYSHLLAVTLTPLVGINGVFCEDITATPTTVYPSGFKTITTTTNAQPGMTTICHQNLSPTGHGDCIGRHCGPQNYWPSQIPTVCETAPISIAAAAVGSVDSDRLQLKDEMRMSSTPTPAPTATTICNNIPWKSISYGDCFGEQCGPKNNWPSDIPKTCTTVVFATEMTSTTDDRATSVQWTAKGGFTHVAW